MSEAPKPIDSLYRSFLEGSLTLQNSNPEEANKLTAALGDSWEEISEQISPFVQAAVEEGRAVTPEEFVESLFVPNADGKLTANIIMGRLQIG